MNSILAQHRAKTVELDRRGHRKRLRSCSNLILRMLVVGRNPREADGSLGLVFWLKPVGFSLRIKGDKSAFHQ
jgi:hypothetical protein